MKTQELLSVGGLAALLLAAVPATVSASCTGLETNAPALVQNEEVDRLIAEGRKLLALKKATEAEGLFNQAAELDGNSFRTRMWVLRSWMDQGGRSNDTLDALDDLSRTNDGPDIDYLYGIAFARRAEEQIAQGLVQSVDMNFGTAIELLSKATELDPERYADAYLPLARAAWFQSQLEVARPAAEEAQRRFPQDPDAAFELGRISLSQFTVAQADPEAGAEADRHWEVARDAFRRAVELCGKPNKRNASGMSLLGQASLQLGHTLMWKDERDGAKSAYVTALAWHPTAVDCGQLFNLLGNADLLAVLEEAAPAFAKRFGADDARDATMLWWLGYVSFAAQKDSEAEAAFVSAVSKAPGFANSWFYIALTRYNQKNYDGATEAFVTGWDTDPAAIVAEMSANVTLNTAKVEYLIGPNVEAGRFDKAAVLAEICAESAVTEARHWNNLGFFHREHAIQLANTDDEAQFARAMATFELSLRGYERSLELAPDDPVFLNDTAVILHYYLDRELDRALDLYNQAEAKAQEKLDADNLAPEEKDLVKIALRDSRNNRRLLKQIMAKKAAEAAQAKKEAEEQEKPADEEEAAGGEG